MKKTIISIIGIAVMLLAITACRPNYVIVPIPGGGTSSTPSGTPVANLDELKVVLADGGEARLTKDLDLEPNALEGLSGTINGAGNTINLRSTTGGEDQAFALILNNVSLKNVTINASNITQTRAAENTFAVLIGSGDGNMDNAPSGITLSNVTIWTGGTIAGINVHTANNVTLEDITIDYCQKAPINISSSIVTIDGLTANGSAWYVGKNIIQINGVGGKPNHQPSTVTFESTEGIDGVWMEAIAKNYDAASNITDVNFQKAGQTVIDGLDSWEVRYSDQPSKDTKGWMFYAPGEDATTFTLNEKAANPEADLRAMIAAVKDSTHKYSAIELSKDVELATHLDVNTSVTIKGAGHTIKPDTSFKKGPNDEFVLISADGVKFQNVVVDGIDTNDGTEAEDWDGEYAIRVYAPDTENQIKVTFSDVTIKDADVGMLVRGGDVTLEGVITFENLDWGGIGVDSIGSNPLLIYESKVDASDCTISYTNDGSTTVAKPAIWREKTNNNETVITSLKEISKAENEHDEVYQTWYVTTNFVAETTEIGSEENVQ